MPVRILSWFLTLALGVAIGVTALAAAFVVIAPLAGQPLDTGFPVSAGGIYALDVPLPAAAGDRETHAQIDRGDLTITLDTLGANLFRALDVAVMGAFWILLIGLLRRFCRNAASDRPFSPATARQLGLAGLLLLVQPVWQAVRSAVWQAIVLAHQGSGGVLVHSFADLPEGGGVRLMPDIDPVFPVAGLVLLVVAQAFRIGVEVQRDSDEVV
jgi:hypothetical protein